MPELSAVLSMIGTFVLIIAVFVGAYFFSKLVGRRYIPQGKGGSGNIEILDNKALGKDQSLVIVRTAGKVMLLSVTANHIEKIEELDPAQIEVPSAVGAAVPSFGSLFKDALRKGRGKNGEGGDGDGSK